MAWEARLVAVARWAAVAEAVEPPIAAHSMPSGAAQKFFERGSCSDLGVVDPLERLGRFTVVLDEAQHAGNEIIA